MKREAIEAERRAFDRKKCGCAALRAEVKRLKATLESIAAGDLCARREQGICEWGVDGPCLSCEAAAALAPRRGKR